MRVPAQLAAALLLALAMIHGIQPGAGQSGGGGDSCDAAPPLDGTVTFVIDGDGGGSACNSFESLPGKWFTYTAPAGGALTVETGPQNASSLIYGDEFPELDTVIGFWASCSALWEVSCNDDREEDLFSRLCLQMDSGDQIYIRISNFYEESGELPMNVTASFDQGGFCPELSAEWPVVAVGFIVGGLFVSSCIVGVCMRTKGPGEIHLGRGNLSNPVFVGSLAFVAASPSPEIELLQTVPNLYVTDANSGYAFLFADGVGFIILETLGLSLLATCLIMAFEIGPSLAFPLAILGGFVCLAVLAYLAVRRIQKGPAVARGWRLYDGGSPFQVQLAQRGSLTTLAPQNPTHGSFVDAAFTTNPGSWSLWRPAGQVITVSGFPDGATFRVDANAAAIIATLQRIQAALADGPPKFATPAQQPGQIPGGADAPPPYAQLANLPSPPAATNPYL